MNKRRGGILLAVSSLPGTLGIGDFGQSTFDWIDLLSSTGSTVWQILPLSPLGQGNSPYKSFSAFAGDEIYISIEKLYASLGLSYIEDMVVSDSVDYASVRERKTQALKQAFSHFVPDTEYEVFVSETEWLREYAVFMALHEQNHERAWNEWENHEADMYKVSYHMFLQYVFMKQWLAIKTYANEKDIMIMGDIPIYLGYDSADVYYNQKYFYLDEKGNPKLVAGVPPDYFSEDGQLWGNPIYNWDALAADGYEYWKKRLVWNHKLFDIVRIDHFRAFDTYWVVDGEETTAKKGKWVLGPGHTFFTAMFESIDGLNLIAEDLGDLRDEVLQLRDDFDLMGMRIIQFSMEDVAVEKNQWLRENLILYTGTHDNQPIGGWLADMSESQRNEIEERMRNAGYASDSLIDAVCRYTLSLPGNYAVLPLQDILRLGNEARTNKPGTVGSPNWEWKLATFDEYLTQRLQCFSQWLRETGRSK